MILFSFKYLFNFAYLLDINASLDDAFEIFGLLSNICCLLGTVSWTISWTILWTISWQFRGQFVDNVSDNFGDNFCNISQRLHNLWSYWKTFQSCYLHLWTLLTFVILMQVLMMLLRSLDCCPTFVVLK